jgi:uncharacterized phiE125 gp8 family phage protein
MSWIVTTPPTSEPVTLAEAKLHLRVTQSSEDVLISALIVAAREHIEQVCELALMPQTWTVKADRFEGLTLPGGVLRGAPTIQYLDPAGALQTLAPERYVVDDTRLPARVSLAANARWPVLLAQANAVVAVCNVGYADAARVPAPIKSALLLIVGDLFENREAQTVGAPISTNPTVDALLWAYRRVTL